MLHHTIPYSKERGLDVTERSKLLKSVYQLVVFILAAGRVLGLLLPHYERSEL